MEQIQIPDAWGVTHLMQYWKNNLRTMWIAPFLIAFLFIYILPDIEAQSGLSFLSLIDIARYAALTSVLFFLPNRYVRRRLSQGKKPWAIVIRLQITITHVCLFLTLFYAGIFLTALYLEEFAVWAV